METAFTVTVLYAPSPWLLSRGELVELPVQCLVSNGYQGIRVDLARPLCSLPADLLQPVSLLKGSKVSKLRSAFKLALQSAMEKHLGCAVRLSHDRIDWGGGDGTGNGT